MTSERARSSRVTGVAREGPGERSGVHDQGAPGRAHPAEHEGRSRNETPSIGAYREEPAWNGATSPWRAAAPWASGLPDTVQGLLAGLAPCPVCTVRPAGGAGVCGPCRARLRAALAPPGEASRARPGDVVWLGPYAGTWLRLVHALKYRGARRLADFLGELLAMRIEASGWCSGPEALDLVTHVPTTTRRKAERGYDQAELLASAVADRLGLRRLAVLRRVHATERLAGRGRAERAALLAGAFRARYLPGRNVLLVDDVLTTGATLGSATEALLHQGASSVRCVVVARTYRAGAVTPT